MTAAEKLRQQGYAMGYTTAYIMAYTMQKGIEKGKLIIAKNLLAKKVDPSLIQEVTGLSKEVLESSLVTTATEQLQNEELKKTLKKCMLTVAKNMLAEKVDPYLVQKVTWISTKELESFQKELK
jgi:predicted transposase YdaD